MARSGLEGCVSTLGVTGRGPLVCPLLVGIGLAAVGGEAGCWVRVQGPALAAWMC